MVGQPLRKLGVSTHLAILPFHLACPVAVYDEVDAQILRSQQRISYKAAMDKLHHQHWIALHKLRHKGRAAWLQGVKTWPDSIWQRDDVDGDDSAAAAAPVKLYSPADEPTLTKRQWVHQVMLGPKLPPAPVAQQILRAQ